jgi:dihydroorotate dehydrogenase electron transfer subunit
VSAGTGGRRQPAPFARRIVAVTANEALGAYRLLWVEDGDAPVPAAGQFAMIAAGRGWGGGADERPYLARACSIARRRADGESAFLLEDVGPGTRRLCELAPGESLAIVGPLGRGFSAPRRDERLILVGGGVGIAPLAILQDQLGDTPAEAMLGFRDARHAAGAALLREAEIATDDGSVGHHGFVTELLERTLRRRRAGEARRLAVRACGPPQMLEAVRLTCERAGVDAELALEASMACGFGSCYGCVVPLRNGSYARVCLDGPVIDAAELACVA